MNSSGSWIPGTRCAYVGMINNDVEERLALRTGKVNFAVIDADRGAQHHHSIELRTVFPRAGRCICRSPQDREIVDQSKADVVF